MRYAGRKMVFTRFACSTAALHDLINQKFATTHPHLLPYPLSTTPRPLCKLVAIRRTGVRGCFVVVAVRVIIGAISSDFIVCSAVAPNLLLAASRVLLQNLSPFPDFPVKKKVKNPLPTGRVLSTYNNWFEISQGERTKTYVKLRKYVNLMITENQLLD